RSKDLIGIIQPLSKAIAGAPNIVKGLIAGLAGFGAIYFAAAKHIMNGYWMGIGFNKATMGGGGFMKTIGGILNPKTWFKGGAGSKIPTPDVGGMTGKGDEAG